MNRIFLALIPVTLLAGCFTQPPAPTADRTPSAVASAPPAAKASAAAAPGTYTVKKGDTLYRIALEHGQDYRELAAWNMISNPSSIQEGQMLRVIPPEPASSGVITRPQVESRPLDAAPPAPAPQATASGQALREPRVQKEPYSDEAYARLNKSKEAAPVAVAAEPPAASQPSAQSAPQPAAATAPQSADGVTFAWPAAGKLLASFNESSSKGIDIAGKAGDPVQAAAEGKVVYAGSGLRGLGQLVIVKHTPVYLSAYAHNRKILVKEGQTVSRGEKIAEMGNTDSDTVKLHFEIRRQGKPVDPLQYLPRK